MTFAAMNVKMNTLTQVAIIWQTGAIVHILGQVQNVKSPAISAESNYAIIAIQRVMLRAITMQVWGGALGLNGCPKNAPNHVDIAIVQKTQILVLIAFLKAKKPGIQSLGTR